jgi:hypothetical protein
MKQRKRTHEETEALKGGEGKTVTKVKLYGN